MSTAELEINILNMFDKLKISPYLYAIEVTDDRDKWVELCDLYNNIKGISKILTLTTEDTKNLWTFIDMFLSIAPGIYKRPKNTSKIPLLMKLYLDRECDLFDNVNDYLDYNDTLDDNIILNIKKPNCVKEWFLFDDELLLNNALDKSEAIEKFQRYSDAYDKLTNGTISNLESIKQEYNKKIQDLYKLLQNTPEPASKRSKHEDDDADDMEEPDKKKHHSELSSELENIFLEQFKDVLKTIERENEKLYAVYTGLTHKKKRHQILKDAYKQYIISCYNSEKEREEKESLKRSIERLESDKERMMNLHREIEHAKDIEIQNLRQQAGDVAYLCNSLRDELNKCKNSSHSKDHEIQKLQQQISQSMTELKSEQEKMLIMKDVDIQKLQHQNNEMVTVCNSLRDELSKCKSEIQELRSKIDKPATIVPIQTNFGLKFDQYIQRYPLVAKQMSLKDAPPKIAELIQIRKQIDLNVEMVMESLLEKHLKRILG